MTPDEIRTICRERFARWTETLVRHHMTPVVAIAIGHDHVKGHVVVLTLEDLDDEALGLLLRGAYRLPSRKGG